MAAKSKNKYDVFKWIENVIQSCETYSQLLTAERLSRLHYDLYHDDYLWRYLDSLVIAMSDEITRQMEENETT